MNKKEVVAELANKLDMTKKEVSSVVDGLIETITESMKKEEKVSFLGFGTFGVKTRKAYQGKNPVSGEAITIAAKQQVHFKVGKGLNSALNP